MEGGVIMTEYMLEAAQEWGVWGILLSLFIEGSAFPFVGTLFIVTVGFLLELSWLELFFVSVAGSALYVLGSYIPYFLSYKLGERVEARLSPERRQKLRAAQDQFTKYGIWSVAIASPLHLGNVVPFVAGMSKMDVKLYSFLTMLGITPSTFILLSFGKFYGGDPETVMRTIHHYQNLVIGAVVAATSVYILYKWKWKPLRKKRSVTDGGPSSIKNDDESSLRT
ncbi:hypothetical protein VL03_11345 [Rossellomorea marisflavi]|nr:hypothetical protein VL03_11345 [Rossellomorea marisflavi]